MYLNRINIPFVDRIHLFAHYHLQNQHQRRLSAKPSIRLMKNSKLAKAICISNIFLIKFSPFNVNFHQTCFPFNELPGTTVNSRYPGVRQCSGIVKITGNGNTGLRVSSVSGQLGNPKLFNISISSPVSEDNNSIYLIKWGLNETVYLKHFIYILEHSKCSTHISSFINTNFKFMLKF